MFKQTFTTACIVAVALGSRPDMKTALAQSNAIRNTGSAQMKLHQNLSQISAKQEKGDHERITPESGVESHADVPHEVLVKAEKADKKGKKEKKDNNGKGPKATNLAQVAAQADAKQDPQVCQIAQNRNKASLPDFYSLLASDNVYEDTDFGHSSDALYWRSANEQY